MPSHPLLEPEHFPAEFVIVLPDGYFRYACRECATNAQRNMRLRYNYETEMLPYEGKQDCVFCLNVHLGKLLHEASCNTRH